MHDFQYFSEKDGFRLFKCSLIGTCGTRVVPISAFFNGNVEQDEQKNNGSTVQGMMELNAISLSSAVTACSRGQQLAVTMKLLKNHKASDTMSYNSAIPACGGQWWRIFELLCYIASPDLVTYSSLAASGAVKTFVHSKLRLLHQQCGAECQLATGRGIFATDAKVFWL